MVNTELIPKDERPRSLQDLIDPKWRGKVGVAKPLFGTTATHAAVLFAHWGDERAKQFFRALNDHLPCARFATVETESSFTSGRQSLSRMNRNGARVAPTREFLPQPFDRELVAIFFGG